MSNKRNFSPSGRVLTLEKNKQGRDFVLGDIHGAYTLVLEAMKAVGFDSSVDRIFSVGDLIDRGSESRRVVKFLEQPYVHAIRGNHDNDFVSMELDIIRWAAGGKARGFSGLEWALNESDEFITSVQKSLRKLPIAMQVKTDRGLVGFVHGDVPIGMNWTTFLEKIEAGDAGVIDCALTERSRVLSNNESGIAGVGRVFLGHTISWEGPKKLGNVFALDTGAVFAEIAKNDPDRPMRGYLSFANICTSTQSLASLPKSAEASRVAVFDQPTESQFSGLTPPIKQKRFERQR